MALVSLSVVLENVSVSLASLSGFAQSFGGRVREADGAAAVVFPEVDGMTLDRWESRIAELRACYGEPAIMLCDVVCDERNAIKAAKSVFQVSASLSDAMGLPGIVGLQTAANISAALESGSILEMRHVLTSEGMYSTESGSVRFLASPDSMGLRAAGVYALAVDNAIRTVRTLARGKEATNGGSLRDSIRNWCQRVNGNKIVPAWIAPIYWGRGPLDRAVPNRWIKARAADLCKAPTGAER